MKIKTMAHINSLKGKMDEITVVKETKPNTYIVEYRGTYCTAIFNWFTCEYYVDDIYGGIKEG